MNELQFIRGELAAQRQRSREIGASWSERCGDAQIRELNEVKSVSYRSYLLFIIDLESKRIASHLDRLGPRSDLSDAERKGFERCAREFEMLSAARALSSTSAARTVESLSRLSTLVRELEAIAESRYGVDDWRNASHIDADSILEERRLRKQALGEPHGRASG